MPRTSSRVSLAPAGPPPYAAPAWALISAFIIYGSVGSFGSGASTWGPLSVAIPDVLQNILLYVPFGGFGVLALDNGRRSIARRAMQVAALACGLSFVAETAQLFVIDRTASVSDMMAGTLGAALGAFSAPAIARLADTGTERARALGIAGSRFMMPLVITLTVMAAVAWWPLDVTLDPGTVQARVSAFRADPWQSRNAIELGWHVLRYGVVTFLMAASLERLRPGHAALAAAISGLLLAIVLDAGQMIMGGRPAGLAHLQFQAAGCLVGSAVFVMTRKAERHPAA